jgi:beta-galactosidase
MKKKSLFLALSVLLVAITVQAQSRLFIPFTGNWQFKKGANPVSLATEDWQHVTLPHTWNATDMMTTKNFYQGDGFYKKQFRAEPAWKDKRVFVRFEGVGQVADVYVNDRFIGQHRGGYSAFAFDISYALKYGEENTMLVKANNEANPEIIPINHNLFGVYGGIYRPVELIITNKLNIAVTDYASPGVYIEQKNVSAGNADIIVSTKLENKTAQPQNAVLESQVFDAAGRMVKTAVSNINILPQGLQKFTQNFSLKKPHLWNGLEDPYLYKVVVRLKQNNTVLDEMVQPLGIRKFEVIGGKSFYLNGKPMRLLGTTRHQDWWGMGSALSNEQHAADLEIIKEMGANSIRLAHYQQAEYMYAKADSMGFVIWAEIPFVNAVSGKEADNAKQQLTELIRQNFNHPSIYTWGLHNEVYGRSPADYTSVLTATLHDLAKTEDPDRPSVSVNGYGTMERHENSLADIQGMNRYFGWYEGKTEDLEGWVKGLEEKYPHHKLMLSEYGAEGNVAQQDEVLPRFNPVNGQYFPEQLQSRFHEIQWGIIEKHPYLLASYIWNTFDFAVPLWSRGGVPARNMKGLVTIDRKIKKDAFYWYKANWSKEPVLYISDRRLVNRTRPTTTITIYANMGTPVLQVNGQTITGVRQGTTKVHYVFENVTLKQGQNKIAVTAQKEGRTYSDEVTWTLQAEGSDGGGKPTGTRAATAPGNQ